MMSTVSAFSLNLYSDDQPNLHSHDYDAISYTGANNLESFTGKINPRYQGRFD